jgi:hypothetical protein
MQVASAIENLVDEHQRVPGSILLALLERVYEMPKTKTKTPKKHANGNCNGVLKERDENSTSSKCESDKAKVS